MNLGPCRRDPRWLLAPICLPDRKFAARDSTSSSNKSVPASTGGHAVIRKSPGTPSGSKFPEFLLKSDADATRGHAVAAGSRFTP